MRHFLILALVVTLFPAIQSGATQDDDDTYEDYSDEKPLLIVKDTVLHKVQHSPGTFTSASGEIISKPTLETNYSRILEIDGNVDRLNQLSPNPQTHPAASHVQLALTPLDLEGFDVKDDQDHQENGDGQDQDDDGNSGRPEVHQENVAHVIHPFSTDDAGIESSRQRNPKGHLHHHHHHGSWHGKASNSDELAGMKSPQDPYWWVRYEKEGGGGVPLHSSPSHMNINHEHESHSRHHHHHRHNSQEGRVHAKNRKHRHGSRQPRPPKEEESTESTEENGDKWVNFYDLHDYLGDAKTDYENEEVKIPKIMPANAKMLSKLLRSRQQLEKQQQPIRHIKSQYQ